MLNKMATQADVEDVNKLVRFKCREYPQLRIFKPDGGYMKFRSGYYATDDPEEIELLRKNDYVYPDPGVELLICPICKNEGGSFASPAELRAHMKVKH
jgi:hypothetical protein